MKILIKNGKIVTAGDLFTGSILIEDGVIKTLAEDIAGSFDQVIDGKGMLVLPGAVDAHTHFNLHTALAASVDDFYSGTVAAACGGTTTVIDHMGFGPAQCDLDHQLKLYHGYAADKAVIDYSFHGVIQHVNDGILNQLRQMIEEEGISSFKLYMTYDYRIPEENTLRLMQALRSLGGLLTVHAENHEMMIHLKERFLERGSKEPIYHALSRPDYCESTAVSRITALASSADNTPIYIVHLTSRLGLQQVAAALQQERAVYAETCPQYLVLDQELYRQEINEGLKYILSPPLRSKKDQEALWRGIRQGQIQVVATDHCSFNTTDKQMGREDFSQCPNGIPGVEERLPLMFSEGVMKGRISINRLVEVCCTNPAKLFGMYPKKGALLPGCDADIVIIDPEKEITLSKSMLHGNGDYSAYEGFKLKGYPVITLSRGEIIVKDNEFVGMQGRGRFIKRKARDQKNWGEI